MPWSRATRNWMVIDDWLDHICDDVVLARPLKVEAIALATHPWPHGCGALPLSLPYRLQPDHLLHNQSRVGVPPAGIETVC